MKKIIFMFIMLSSLTAYGASERDLLLDGVKQYKKERYGEAFQTFERAQAAAPHSQKPIYNQAAALYKLNDYKQSAGLYKEVAQSEDAKLSQKAMFNLGNALYRSGDKEGAKQAYKNAILLNPKDKAAIHNLQLMLQDKPQDDKSENKEKDENEDNDKQEGENEQQQNGQTKDNQMSKENAERLLQMMREQEEKDQNNSDRQYGAPDEEVEKDW